MKYELGFGDYIAIYLASGFVINRAITFYKRFLNKKYCGSCGRKVIKTSLAEMDYGFPGFIPMKVCRDCFFIRTGKTLDMDKHGLLVTTESSGAR